MGKSGKVLHTGLFNGRRPTKDLSSICCSMKLRTERKTSSASCCTLTAKQRQQQNMAGATAGQNVKVVVSLTSNTIPIQTVKEVVMVSRLRVVAAHGGEDPLQLQGDIAVIVPHAACIPPGPETVRILIYFFIFSWFHVNALTCPVVVAAPRSHRRSAAAC